jgi:hypothetical protein
MADFDFNRHLQPPKTNKDLFENIQETKEIVLRYNARELLTKDLYGFDILRVHLRWYPELKDKNISSIRVEFVKNPDRPLDDILVLDDVLALDDILENAKYNFHADAFSLLFYGDFAQNKNLMQPGVIFPMHLIYHQDVRLHILNIQNLSAIVDHLDIVISATEVLYNEEFSKELATCSRVEQWFKRTDNTCNLLTIISGLASQAYGEDLEKTPEEISTFMER